MTKILNDCFRYLLGIHVIYRLISFIDNAELFEYYKLFKIYFNFHSTYKL